MADSPQSTVITWNMTNWITITLMGLVAFALWGLGQTWYQKRTKTA